MLPHGNNTLHCLYNPNLVPYEERVTLRGHRKPSRGRAAPPPARPASGRTGDDGASRARRRRRHRGGVGDDGRGRDEGRVLRRQGHRRDERRPRRNLRRRRVPALGVDARRRGDDCSGRGRALVRGRGRHERRPLDERRGRARPQDERRRQRLVVAGELDDPEVGGRRARRAGRAAASARRRRRTASRGAGTAAGRAGLGSRGEYLGRGDFRGRGGVFGRAGVACVTCAGSGLRRLQSDAGPAAASSTRGVAMGVRSGRGVARSAWAWRPVSTGAGRRFSIGGNRTAGPSSRGVAAAPASPAQSAMSTLSSFACSAARSNNCLRCWLRSWAAAGAGAVGAWCVDGGDAVIARRGGVVDAISCRGPLTAPLRGRPQPRQAAQRLCARLALEFGVSVALRAPL